MRDRLVGCCRLAGGAPRSTVRGTSGTELAAAVAAARGAVEQRPVERVASRGGRRNDVAISGGVCTLSRFAPWAWLMYWNCVGTHGDHAPGRYRKALGFDSGLYADFGLTSGLALSAVSSGGRRLGVSRGAGRLTVSPLGRHGGMCPPVEYGAHGQ